MTKRFEFTPATKAAIRAKGDCCWACGVPGWIGIEVDHIIPRCDAATHNGESNGQMLCSTCNNVKGNVTFAVAPRKRIIRLVLHNNVISSRLDLAWFLLVHVLFSAFFIATLMSRRRHPL